MEIILIKAFQLICCLSLLVLLHEGGHFAFAKLFKVRVEKFYMFFNYKFHLFSTRDNWFTRMFPRFKDNETEYGIGWIPLGGYVSIAGMVDETKGADEVGEAKPGDFLTKPVWQRFFIMFGGVLVNFLTALVLYSIILFTWGQDVLPMRNMTQGLAFNDYAKSIGFRNGDIPVKLDGEDIESFTANLYRDMSNASSVTVLRDGKEVLVNMPDGGVNMVEMLEEPRFFSPWLPCVVANVRDSLPADLAGVRKGDVFLAIDGNEVQCAQDVSAYLSNITKNTFDVVVERDGANDTLSLFMGESDIMGVEWDASILQSYQQEHIDYTALSCIPAGCKYGWEMLCGYVNDLKYIPTKKGAKSVGSFITIGSIFPSAWDWQRFWLLTAMISIILAVMNILPIPGLDGGHIVLLIYEGITGKQPSVRAMEIIEKVGLTLLVGLMILALGNDFVRFFL